MPKIKTHSATKKRIKITRGKKRQYIERRATQDHFNAKQSGTLTRKKRRSRKVNTTSIKKMKRLLPHS